MHPVPSHRISEEGGGVPVATEAPTQIVVVVCSGSGRNVRELDNVHCSSAHCG